MAKNNQVLLRLNDPQFEAFKNFAEDRDYNDAEAAREIVKSRLAGEGYLQNQHYDSPVTDGGELLDEFEKARSEIQTQSKQIEEQEQVQRTQGLLLFLSIFWLAVHLIFSVPSVVTVATGTILVGGLVYTHVYQWGK